MLGYPGRAVVGDIDVDETNLLWVLLLMFFPLCPALCLSLVLANLCLTEAWLSCKVMCQ